MATGRVLTIGYGSHSREAFLEQLKRAEVNYVIDVRSVPHSRFQPDFSREPLFRFLRENHLGYVFMGDLLGGRPKDDDCYVDGRVDYTKTRTKDFFVQGISRLKKARDQGFNVCLLCSEARPSQCHRAKLVAAALVDEGIDVTHILPDGSTQTQEDVIAELTAGQTSMFSEHFVSRKTYR